MGGGMPMGGGPGGGQQPSGEEKKEGVAEAAPKTPGLLPTTPDAAAAEESPQALEAVRARGLLPDADRLGQELQRGLPRRRLDRRRTVAARAVVQRDRDQPSVRRHAVEREHAAPPRADVQHRRGHVGSRPSRRVRQPGARLDADRRRTCRASTPTTNRPPIGAFGNTQGNVVQRHQQR